MVNNGQDRNKDATGTINRNTDATGTLKWCTNTHRLAEVSVHQQQLTEQWAQRQHQTEQELATLRAAVGGAAPVPTPRAHAHQLLTKLTDQDDVEACLHTFEVIATRELWEKSAWAQILAPYLTGEAQRAYYSLQPLRVRITTP